MSFPLEEKERAYQAEIDRLQEVKIRHESAAYDRGREEGYELGFREGQQVGFHRCVKISKEYIVGINAVLDSFDTLGGENVLAKMSTL
jgi:flagellar biosynthesis/type III secretory pathway protein FliH